jgi:AraC-like DNA-binding protein
MRVLNQIDSTTYWRHPRVPDLCLLKARFTQHRYELHTHSTYVIALITAGCERLRIGARQVSAPRGTVLIVNPEECHDGEAGAPGGWSYRTLYPSVRLMADIAREFGSEEPPVFANRVINEPILADAIAAAHRTAEHDGDDAETSLIVALRHLVRHHADDGGGKEPIERSGAPQRFGVYADAIERDLASALDLQHLANLTRVTRFQVIRDFKRITGLTPGRYLRNQRLRHATNLIRQGATSAEAAASAGFSDQSHLSRTFKRINGITPATFQRAHRSQ